MLKLKDHNERLNHKDYQKWLSENKEFLPYYFEKMKEYIDKYEFTIQKELNYYDFCRMMFESSKDNNVK